MSESTEVANDSFAVQISNVVRCSLTNLETFVTETIHDFFLYIL